MGVWVDECLSWTGYIERVRTKVGQLLGVLWRAGSVLGGVPSSHSIMVVLSCPVLPHLHPPPGVGKLKGV